MTQRPLGAQISHMLKSRGVSTIFGIPGVHNQEMYRGIEEAGITHVLARHEQGAGFMADGYARATGKPGVAYVITGPGLLNAMTPLGQADSDSVSVLAISSCLDETAAKRGQLHQMRDQETAAACVCDWSHEGRSPDAIYDLIDRAFAEFSSARPRAKHIQVPIALGEALADPCPAPKTSGPSMPHASADQIEQAAKMLRGARKPLFIFGGGASHAAPAARALMKQISAASFTSYAGRGIIADDPLHFGAYLARPDSAQVIAEADLVVVIGSELAEVDLWRDDIGIRSPLIRIDIDPAELEHPRADLAILGDAAHALQALRSALPEPQSSDWKAEDIRNWQTRWQAETDADRPGIVPICMALQQALPKDMMVYSDMTQFAYVAKEVWPMPEPGLWHHPYGFGTLGYALPAAIGGAVARRGVPTLAIAGDYGFQYTLPELGVAVELGLSLPILLWDNGKLKEIEDSMTRAQIAPNAVIAYNPDFGALARAYGAHATAPKTVSDLIADIQAGFQADRPTLIHVTPQITD